MTDNDRDDQAIEQWLSAISPLVRSASSFSPVLISVQGRVVYVICTHRYMAQQILNYKYLLTNSKFGLEVLVGGKHYAFMPPVSTPEKLMTIVNENTSVQNSQWATRNPSVIDLMSDDGTVSVHGTDRDSGYPLLTVCPYRSIEETLCLPIDQLVGKAALDAWDKTRAETEVIAVTKQRVIEEVISTGEKATHTYEMMWNGLLWHMAITGVVVADGEVLCITRQMEEYQRKYWENYVT